MIHFGRSGPIALIAVSDEGARLGLGLRARFAGPGRVTLWAARPYIPEVRVYQGTLAEFVGGLWHDHVAIVGVMASGIMVRAIAPSVTSKFEDPAVVVLDDAGRYAISLLSGHEGGANSLAEQIAAETQGQAVVTTGSEARRRVVVGIGARRGVSEAQVLAALDEALTAAGRERNDVRAIATIDLKREEAGILTAAERLGVPVQIIGRERIRVLQDALREPGFVEEITGVAAVCEPAADAGRRTDAPPRAETGAGRGDGGAGAGHLWLVGLGPGGRDHLTAAAAAALSAADVIVGYKPYLELVADLAAGKRTVASGMRQEATRAEAAVAEATAGARVAVVSSGDAGVYGMAGLVLELLPEGSPVSVDVVPGVTAASAAAACLGAPLMNDFAVVSLSDLLTPLEVIERRLTAATDGDFVLALYNPRGTRRREPLRRALGILRERRASGTPVGLVRNALREGQQTRVTTLGELREDDVDMLTILIVGNSATVVRDGRMVTHAGTARDPRAGRDERGEDAGGRAARGGSRRAAERGHRIRRPAGGAERCRCAQRRARRGGTGAACRGRSRRRRRDASIRRAHLARRSPGLRARGPPVPPRPAAVR